METPSSATKAASPSLTADDLARVEGALEDIHLKESKSDPNPLRVPPAVFGAGSPMSAHALHSRQLATDNHDPQAEAV